MEDKHWDLRVISGTYKLEPDDKISVELYGHTKEGKSIVVRDTVSNHINGRPYCFIIPDEPKKVQRYLENNKDVLKVNKIKLLYKGKDTDCLKITTRVPKNVKYLRDDKNINGTFLAADILFHLRYIYDNDIDACIRVYGKKIAKSGYNTQIIVEKERYEKIEPFNPKLKILSFDIENSLKDTKGPLGSSEDEMEIEDEEFYNKQILCICCVLQEKDQIIDKARFYGSETKILQEFSEYIKKTDPDVISGYNIEGYDIRVMNIRAKKLNVPLQWGRDGSCLDGIRDPKYNKINWGVNGRLIVDTWWAVKMELKPKQESLNAVSKQLLNEQKLDVDARKMDEEWTNNREKVLEYCEQDAILSLKILNKLERLRKMMDMGTVSKMPLSEVNKNRSSLLIDSILMRETNKDNIAVPLSGIYDEDEEAIEGAYVHEMYPGLYHWICVLDFKSMYPSIIISNNICFTTISENGTIESPSGTKFLSKDVREGILPRILVRLMNYRDDIKLKMANADTEEDKKYYDGLQGAIKIYMNSFYGVFASSFYRFTDKHIGSSVTSFSRDKTKAIIKDIESTGNKVLYSDTDSIFVKSPVDNLDGSKEFGKGLVEKYSREGGILEFEKIFEAMFSHGKKKRYVGKIVWPKKDILIRGYEIRRTDSFDVQSETMMEVFNKILDDKIEEAIKVARDTVQKVLKGNVPIENIVISKGCKAFNQYVRPESQATVQAAKKLQALGFEFIPGMKVSWIVTNANITPQEVTPWIKDRTFELTPDWKYYAERMAHTLSRITEVYGVTSKDLLAGNVQSSLFDNENGNKPTMAMRINNRKKTVEDYM